MSGSRLGASRFGEADTTHQADMNVVIAEGTLLEQILDLTFPIWSEGLARAAYGQWNRAQLRTAWGRDHLHRLALVAADGTLLATLKRYRYDARLDGREIGRASCRERVDILVGLLSLNENTSCLVSGHLAAP